VCHDASKRRRPGAAAAESGVVSVPGAVHVREGEPQLTDQTTDQTTQRPTSSPSTPAGPARGPRILLYSDDRTVRAQVRTAVGPRLRAHAPEIAWAEVATPAVLVAAADRGGWDLLVVDGEADKAGGMGLCRQLKNEVYRCPPIVVLTGRPDDGWLASWSLADGVVPRPLDAIELQRTVAGLLTTAA
jgi:CheY-like chemotaxis protein